MINQGFVTDSDTEKELKKWQQARTTAVDEDKLKQQYKNRLNNAQGQHFMPMVRDTPALRDKINEKSRTAGNTIFKKAFPGGRITMTGANSPTELRSRPIRILLADEIDAYPPTAML